MRNYLFLGTLLLGLTGCGSNSKTNDGQTTDSTASTSPAPASDTTCYLQVTGRDSTLLRLIVNGSEVSGELAVLPFEKDRARGPIRGTLADNQIRADWQRAGEGVTQPYEVVFTLQGDAASWREGERIEKSGKWVLKNPEQGYEYKLMKTECR